MSQKKWAAAAAAAVLMGTLAGCGNGDDREREGESATAAPSSSEEAAPTPGASATEAATAETGEPDVIDVPATISIDGTAAVPTWVDCAGDGDYRFITVSYDDPVTGEELDYVVKTQNGNIERIQIESFGEVGPEWGSAYLDVDPVVIVAGDLWTVNATLRDAAGQTTVTHAEIQCTPDGYYETTPDGTLGLAALTGRQTEDTSALLAQTESSIMIDGVAATSVSTPDCNSLSSGYDQIDWNGTLADGRVVTVSISFFTDGTAPTLVVTEDNGLDLRTYNWVEGESTHVPPSIGMSGTNYAVKGSMAMSDGSEASIEAAAICPVN